MRSRVGGGGGLSFTFTFRCEFVRTELPLPLPLSPQCDGVGYDMTFPRVTRYTCNLSGAFILGFL